ncbi:hypothetical protein PROPEN_01093 [Proteus penneri ATCC 35198]|nr:hypothetical protein PROPEN_01093 [Proteus penneri ATCC 35198]
MYYNQPIYCFLYKYLFYSCLKAYKTSLFVLFGVNSSVIVG